MIGSVHGRPRLLAPRFVQRARIHSIESELIEQTDHDRFRLRIIAGDGDGPLIGVPTARSFAIPRHPTPGLGRDRVGPVFMIALGDEDWAALRPRLVYRHLRTHPFFTTLAILAIAMAVGAYPVARRVTR